MTSHKSTSAGNSEDEHDLKEGSSLKESKDHAINWRRGLSWARYPKNCPSLSVQWFHAVDVPKRNPLSSNQTGTDKKPRKYVPFSKSDSRAIENTYQKLLEEEENKGSRIKKGPNEETANNQSEQARKASHIPAITIGAKVAVNEDYLFDVDLDNRELAPAYWLGPVYDVRRGTWFFVENSRYRPCDENLATQLEEGYLKLRPWDQSSIGQDVPLAEKDNLEVAPHRDQSSEEQAKEEKIFTTNLIIADQPNEIVTSKDSQDKEQKSDESIKVQRLFGAYANSIASYQDEKIAYIVTDDFMSRMSGTLYEKLGGRSHYAGVKVMRGFVGLSEQSKETKSNEQVASIGNDDKKENPPVENAADKVDENEMREKLRTSKVIASEVSGDTIDRKLSSLMTTKTFDDSSKQEKVAEQRDNKQIKTEYKGFAEDQHREIEHLILAVHGIGQRLSLRMESVNFIHDINTLRKSLKAVYAESTELQALNPEADSEYKNCRVQVLPVCWRHLLDFPRQSLKFNREEYDLGEANADEDEYPKLHDITVQGVPAMRNLITDLALDILLYQSVAYRGHIASIVTDECNRIYELFRSRNPDFKGKVSIVGHSLGSAIVFDILCNQNGKESLGYPPELKNVKDGSLKLKFDVEHFYALGSPIGLFEMLNGHKIAAQHAAPDESRPDSEKSRADVNKQNSQAGIFREPTKPAAKDITMSRPKLHQLYNIFHPSDPISYRIEPLVSSVMSKLNPMPLPYTKKGLFDTPMGQGLTGISSRVGQGFSGLWSSFSSGLAGSLINRSVGLPVDEPRSKNMKADTNVPQSAPTPQASGTNVAGGIVELNSQGQESSSLKKFDEVTGKLESNDALATSNRGDTLFANFQTFLRDYHNSKDKENKQNELEGESQIPPDEQRKMRRDKAKIKALNKNGRLDYCIQEGAFDISLIASIASHLSYWADEDVSHFIMSQLLSKHKEEKKSENRSEAEKS